MSRRNVIVLSLLLFGVVVLSYAPSLRNGFVNLDDNTYVYKNAHVQRGLSAQNLGWAFTSVEAGFWHPLTWLSILADAQLYGMRPAGYHFTNVLLHAFSSLALFWLFCSLTGALWRSAVVAALFALHPLHVECVAWVSSRKDVLSTLFWMLSLLTYVRWVRRSEGGAQRPDPSRRSYILHPPSSILYLLSLLFFVCGLMSKTMVITLPFILLLLDWWPLGRLKSLGSGVLSPESGSRGPESTVHSPQSPPRKSQIVNRILEKLPFLAAALVAGLLTLRAERAVGALRTVGEFPLGYRIANAALSSVAYLWQTLWPQHLAVYYPAPKVLPSMAIAGAVVLLLAFSALAVWKARTQPYLAFGWIWYGVTLLPVIGLIQVGSHSRADRYTYVPLIGLFVLLVWGTCDLTRRWRHQAAFCSALTLIVATACILCARAQLGYWQSSETLFAHALAVTADNAVMRNSLGGALAAEGRLDEALVQLQEAVRLSPGWWEAQNNLGTALARRGRLDEALPSLRTAVRLAPEAPEGHRGLADTLAVKGLINEAIIHYKEVIRLAPADPTAYHSLGLLLALQGAFAEAIPQFQEAIRLNPDYAEAHCHLGITLGKTGRVDEAMPHLRAALQLDPNYAEAHCNLGGALCAKGRWDEAIGHFEQALKLKPDYAEARNYLRAAQRLKSAAPGSIPPP